MTKKLTNPHLTIQYGKDETLHAQALQAVTVISYAYVHIRFYAFGVSKNYIVVTWSFKSFLSIIMVQIRSFKYFQCLNIKNEAWWDRWVVENQISQFWIFFDGTQNHQNDTQKSVLALPEAFHTICASCKLSPSSHEVKELVRVWHIWIPSSTFYLNIILQYCSGF